MEKIKKRLFNVCGIFATILIVGALMGLFGNIQTGGFSVFLIINSVSIFALLFFSVSLFLKSFTLIKIALIINTLVSLFSIIFGFTFQELLIFITLLFITINLILIDKIKNNYLFQIAGVCFSCLIVAATLIGFTKNIINYVNNNEVLLFNFEKWLYYFSPFIYASLYASLTIMLSLLINDSIVLKDNKNISYFIPLIIVSILIIVSLILSIISFNIDKTINSIYEIFLLLIDILGIISVLSTPIFLLVINKNK